MKNDFQIMPENSSIIRNDGESISLVYNNCTDSRCASLDYLIQQSLKDIPNKNTSINTFFEKNLDLNFTDSTKIEKKNSFLILSKEKSDLVLPCWSFDHLSEYGIHDYDETCSKIEQAGKKEYLYNKIIWVGKLSSPTRKMLFLKFNNEGFFDIRKLNYNWADKNESPILPKEYISLEDHTKYKYILDLQGAGGKSTRLKFFMFSNRPIFLQEREIKEYWMWDLIPFIHYIPIEYNLSDLNEKIEWAENHPEECREIAKNAYQFAINNLKRKHALFRISSVLSKEHKNEEYDKLNILSQIPKNYQAQDVKYIHYSEQTLKNLKDQKYKSIFLCDSEKPIGSLINDNTIWERSYSKIPFFLRSLYYILGTATNADWLLVMSNKKYFEIEKINNILNKLNSNDNIVISQDKRVHSMKKILFICERIKNFDPSFDISHLDLNNINYDVDNFIISKSAINQIKKYKHLNKLINILNQFCSENINQIIFILALILKTHHFKLDRFLEEVDKKQFYNFYERKIGVWYVNHRPLGGMALNLKNNFIEIYDHDNERTFSIDHSKKEICFYRKNGEISSKLTETKENTYEGASIDSRGKIIPNTWLTLGFCDEL